MRVYNLALIPGDGIGVEQTEATLTVLDAVQRKHSINLQIEKVEAGDACERNTGTPLPESTLKTIQGSDACLKGPVGESAYNVIIKLRQLLDLFANVRPAKAYPGVPSLDPAVDLVIVRENTEDLYRGIEFQVGDDAMAVRVITRKACERISDYAFQLAERRGGKRRVTAIHKANVLKVSDGLFVKVCNERAQRYRKVKFDELYVDAAAMNLIRMPSKFDVLVTTNMFGDILSDEAAQVVGGLGLAPSANIGEKYAIFEPVHGSAPDIAGKQISNPMSMILSAKMMFEWLGEARSDDRCREAANSIEKALINALSSGVKTPDLGGAAKTSDMGRAIARNILAE